jgi:hypothetical protein
MGVVCYVNLLCSTKLCDDLIRDQEDEEDGQEDVFCFLRILAITTVGDKQIARYEDDDHHGDTDDVGHNPTDTNKRPLCITKEVRRLCDEVDIVDDFDEDKCYDNIDDTLLCLVDLVLLVECLHDTKCCPDDCYDRYKKRYRLEKRQ